MSDALFLENSFQRSFKGEHQIHYKHKFGSSRNSSVSPSSKKSTKAAKNSNTTAAATQNHRSSIHN